MIVPIQHAGFGLPKYKKLILSIESKIESGELSIGDALPSINELRHAFDFSRDTILTGLNELKARGIIQAISGKGFYVSSSDVSVKQKIFVLFDELNAFKEDLYNAFLNHLPSNYQVDIFFHHFNRGIFSKLISDHAGQYSFYVVMPANFGQAEVDLSQLSANRVFVLDQTNKKLSEYPAVYQNFEKGIFESLLSVNDRLGRYSKLNFVFSDKRQPKSMLKGFKRFESVNNIKTDYLKSLDERQAAKGEAYLVLEDRDLILLIKSVKSQGLVLGQDVAVISYNDTMFKEILEGGITTISTDFKTMGVNLAAMILNKENLKLENPTHIIIRKSL